jgi:hypothetical protein
MTKIRRASSNDSLVVTMMIDKLLCELSGNETSNSKLEPVVYDLLDQSDESTILPYLVLLAFDDSSDEVIGVISSSESRAVYTNGKFGVIHELYVLPEHRSNKVGA